jgi:hypothetical protein
VAALVRALEVTEIEERLRALEDRLADHAEEPERQA